ncbi:hypothetical protein HAZT_HAZT010936 [Hyalella azteca]|uniref:C2H2-type domain-containing protein n=1 Tax=Hyalella azteca TaxID=294128 RepID=A0A6A0HAX1_HYAAZ|nr:hypothetical protein HAZT_HAZT010936 [Hyalella azteca]
MRGEDLEALLDYMYAGEVEVKHSSLASLIKAAECLCIKGLAVPDGDQAENSPLKSPVINTNNCQDNPTSKRRKLDRSSESRFSEECKRSRGSPHEVKLEVEEEGEEMLLEKTEEDVFDEAVDSSSSVVNEPWRSNQDGGSNIQDGVDGTIQNHGSRIVTDGDSSVQYSEAMSGAGKNMPAIEDDLDRSNHDISSETSDYENSNARHDDRDGRQDGGRDGRQDGVGSCALLKSDEDFDEHRFTDAELETHDDVGDEEGNTQREADYHEDLNDDDVSILRDDRTMVSDGLETLRSMGISIQNSGPSVGFLPQNLVSSTPISRVDFAVRSHLPNPTKLGLGKDRNTILNRSQSQLIGQLNPVNRGKGRNSNILLDHGQDRAPTAHFLNHEMGRTAIHGNPIPSHFLNDSSSLTANPGLHPGLSTTQSVTLDDLRSSLSGFDPHSSSRKEADEPLHCPFCGKLCKRRDHLRLHIRIHTGEKPFKCPYCDRRTNQKNNLKLHIRNVHPGLPVMVSGSW